MQQLGVNSGCEEFSESKKEKKTIKTLLKHINGFTPKSVFAQHNLSASGSERAHIKGHSSFERVPYSYFSSQIFPSSVIWMPAAFVR